MVNTKNLKTITQKERQANYTDQLDQSKERYSIAAGAAAVRSLQNIGYGSTGSAAADIVDNSIEANASKIAIDIVYEDKLNLSEIIFADNGIGMPPKLLRKAMTYGGTDREGSDDLFGRFGFGLPSASMSQGDQFIVISKQEGEGIFENTFDLDICASGGYTDNHGVVEMPEPRKIKSLPTYLQEIADKSLGGFDKGTFVIVKKLSKSRMSHNSYNGLRDHLKKHLGATFHRFLNSVKVTICNDNLQPLDPSFQNTSGRAYDVGGTKAQPFESQEFELVDKLSGKKGKVIARFSYLGQQFLDADPIRRSTATEWNGIMIERNGRIIDCITNINKSMWPNQPSSAKTVFQPLDAWYTVSLDFDASLDDLFGVETTKQRAVPNAQVWDVLENSKMFFPMITKLSKMTKDEKNEKEAQLDVTGDNNDLRPSEIAAEMASSFQNLPASESDYLEKEGETKLTEIAEIQLAENKKDITQENLDEAKENITVEGDLTNKKYKLGTRSILGGDFIFIDVIGPQLRVDLNKEHSFYQDFYMNDSSNGVMRQYIEAFLFSIAERVNLNEDNKYFYNREISAWTSLLNDSFKEVKRQVSAKNRKSLPKVG